MEQNDLKNNKQKEETVVEDKQKTGDKKEEKLVKKSEVELLKEEIAKIKSEKQKLESDKEDFKNKWMRSVAEFDNYKKRNANIWNDAFIEGSKEVIVKILSVGDNLDFALTMELDSKTLEGIKKIKRQFDDTLKNLEVEVINPVGEVFNPNLAEAVMQIDKAEGEKSETVKQVFLKGYKLKNKIIRYAKVSVIK